VSTDDEETLLRNGMDSKDDAALTQAASAVEKRAFIKMWELEGKDVEEALYKNEKRGARGRKPTYLAIGKRMGLYKGDRELKLGKMVYFCESVS